MKLFAYEDLDNQIDERQTTEQKLEGDISVDVTDTINEYEADLQIASEGFLRASNELSILNDIKISLESKKLSSVEYFTSIENYNLYLKSIANNLGIKAKIPSMEDFKNPYGIKVSHQIVLEGFNDFIRTVWEKIKDFFKTFFKKVMLFLKRLVNADLQLEEYEEYIAGMISKVKTSRKDTVDPIDIQSKLPSLLADPEMNSVDTHYILTRGGYKLNNLQNVRNEIYKKNFSILIKFIKELKSSVGIALTKESISDKKIQIGIIREDCIKSLTDGFISNSIDMNRLPDDIYSSVSNVFDRDETPNNIYSLISERNIDKSLPKNFNIFCAVSTYNVTESLSTSKIFLAGTTEKNIHIKNIIKTIPNSNNLIKYYEEYKKFSKNFNYNEIIKQSDELSNEIDKTLSKISELLNKALTPKHIVRQSGGDITGDLTPTDQGKPMFEFNPIENNNETIVPDNKDIEEFQKFMFNYLYSLQTLIKEVNVNLVGTYQECRHEMIKLLYKSCQQF